MKTVDLLLCSEVQSLLPLEYTYTCIRVLVHFVFWQLVQTVNIVRQLDIR